MSCSMKFLKYAAVLFLTVFSQGSYAMEYPYWHLADSDQDATFKMELPDQNTGHDPYIEFGYYTVNDIENPDGATVQLTTLLAANAAQNSEVSMDADSAPSVFGFYIKNVNNNRIWLSDESITGSFSSGDLSGLSVMDQPERFKAVLDNNTWYFTFHRIKKYNSTVRAKFSGTNVSPVPEPATLLLMGSGLVGLAGFARRRHKKA